MDDLIAATRQLDPDNRAAKDRGELCFRHGCQAPGPRFGVLWKCPAGHRKEFLYCAECGPQAMAVALKSAGKGGPLCERCPGAVLMAPAGAY